MSEFENFYGKINETMKMCDKATIYHDKCCIIKEILQKIQEEISKNENLFSMNEINSIQEEINKISESIKSIDVNNLDKLKYDLNVKEIKNNLHQSLDNITKTLKEKGILINDMNEHTISKYKLTSQMFKATIQITSTYNYIIYDGINLTNGDKVNLTVFNDKYPVDKFRKNVKLLSKIDHQNLEKFIGYYETPKYTIVTSRKGQTLKKILDQDDDDNIDDKEDESGIREGYRTIIAYEVAVAMSYVHANKILHRDLRSENIKIDYEDPECITKVTNFANSKFVPNINLLLLSANSTAFGTFQAPEVNSGEGYTEAADVFSYAGILYELLTGHPPFHDKSPDETERLISLSKRPPISEEGVDKELINLIQICWSQRSSERPSFLKIINDFLFKNIRFPGENENEITNNYFLCHQIKNNDIETCLKTYKSILEEKNKTYLYESEVQRVIRFLTRYVFYLETSSLSQMNVISDSKTKTYLKKIKEELKMLQETIRFTSREEWASIYLMRPITEITEQLHKSMVNIYKSMNALGFNFQKPYFIAKKDISNDYRRLYNEINNESSKRVYDPSKQYAPSPDEINEEEEDEADDDDDSNNESSKSVSDSNSQSPNECKDDKNKLAFEKLKKLEEDKKLEIEKFMAEHDIKLELEKIERDEKLHGLLDNLKNWRVNEKDFKLPLKNKIGGGYSCAVYKSTRKSDGMQVAIKVIGDGYINNEDKFKLVCREICSLITLKNEYFAEFIGFKDYPGNLWIITKFYKDKSLGYNLKHNYKSFNNLQLTKIAFEIAQGMAYLHSKQFIHRDLKPENILLENFKSNSVTPKICDLGFIKKFMSLGMSGQRGTPSFMAPEVINESDYGYKADVFSYGIILYEMKYGCNPYKECQTIDEVFEKITRGDPFDYSGKQISDKLKKLIDDCTKLNQNERPSFDEIIKRMCDEKIDFSTFSFPDILNFYANKETEIIPKK